MKIKFLYIIFSLFFVFLNLFSYSQGTFIKLDKKIHYPILTYNPVNQQLLHGDLDSTHKARKCHLFVAGDYSDSITKFRIVVGPINDESGNPSYDFYITPYRCDSVYLGTPSISGSSVTIPSIAVGMGKRKFKIYLLEGDKDIRVTDISSEYISPDIRLFNNKLPDLKFPLLSGGSQSFTSLEHQHKLIYLYFWGSTDNIDSCLDYMEPLKEVFDTYKSKVTIVSLFFPFFGGDIDTLKVKKTVIDRKQECMQGFADLALMGDLFENGLKYGMLFDENGNVIKMFMMPDKLKAYLKERYGQ